MASAGALPRLEVRLSRADRVYRPGEAVQGVLLVYLAPRQPISHTGLTARAVGMAETTHPRVFQTPLLTEKLLDVPEGKVTSPDNGGAPAQFPFQFKVPGETTLETYHGNHANVNYAVAAEIKRGMFASALSTNLEFVVETAGTRRPGKLPPPVPFAIRCEDHESALPPSLRGTGFEFAGAVAASTCAVNYPLEGEVHVVHRPPHPVRELLATVVRVETVGKEDNAPVFRSPVVTVQAADGDFAAQTWPIPLHIVLPRLFCCPDVSHVAFRVRFELDITVVFAPLDDPKASAGPAEVKATVPLTLYREREGKGDGDGDGE